MKAERSRGGFTLLEVLAAVAILGILFSMLSSSSIQSLRRQGENYRRVQAGLIADHFLAEIETGLANGTLPEEGETEEVEERENVEFTVRIQTQPFDAYADVQDAPVVTDEDSTTASDLLALLTTDAPELPELLWTIRVEVLWKEGADEKEVVRSTYGLDTVGALVAFPYDRVSGGQGLKDGLDEDDRDESRDEGDPS